MRPGAAGAAAGCGRSRCAPARPARTSARAAIGPRRRPAPAAGGAGHAPASPPAARSAPAAGRGGPASARAAGWRGRRPRPGRRDRSAIPATPRRCAAADPARAVAGSAGWWRRPARPPSPAPTVQTHQLRPGTSAPTVGGRTSSTPAAGAPAAACRSGAPVETVATPPRDQPRADSLGTTSSATCSANSTGCRSGMVCTSVAPSAAYSTTSATNASTSTSAGRVTRTVFWMLS